MKHLDKTKNNINNSKQTEMKQLNGKAKEEFEKYVSNLEVAPYLVMLDQIPQCYLNALIIDFFDSVGIYILISPSDNKDNWCFVILEEDIMSPFYESYKSNDDSKSRTEATEKAIEKAVEIFNQK